MNKLILRFRDDRTFTIVQATDLHWRNGNRRDRRMLRVLADALDVERPDLVVITGDTIDSSKCKEPARGWQAVADPMIDRRIPWAAVFGNHDDEGPMSRDEQMRLMRALPLCLSEPGPEGISGVGNTVLRVRAADADRTAAALVLLDVPEADPAVGGYGWVRDEQIAWFRRTADNLRQAHGGTPVPALVFLHIPLPEYNEVWEAGVCHGHKHEKVCCPEINSGLFDAMVEAGGVMGVFAGHDHVNDYVGTLRGIRLAYGRAGGFNTYGRRGFQKGVRVIRLTESTRAFETWLRLADGSRTDQGDNMDESAIVLFDGACRLCSRVVHFVSRRDPHGRFRFVPQQSEQGRALMAHHGLSPERTETVVLVEKGQAQTRSDAALAIARGLSWPWPVAALLRVVPRFIRDRVYDVVARHRHRWWGRVGREDRNKTT